VPRRKSKKTSTPEQELTHNVQDFVGIPGLHIVDWLGP
jgi:hypothetical protein